MGEKMTKNDIALLEELEKSLKEERQAVQDSLNLFQKQLNESLVQIQETLDKLKNSVLD